MADGAVFAVFAKPPVPGLAKTRLAAAIGELAAAELAAAFLTDTVAALRRVGAPFVVASTGDAAPAELGLPADVEVWQQGDGDLGARLERVLRRGIARYGAAIALGADSPGMPDAHLRAVHGWLHRRDAVIGPADDGGYYAIGMRRCPEGVLRGIPWSTSRVAAATRARLEGQGLTVVDGPAWWDVDDPDDLARLARLAPEAAPATHAALVRRGLAGR